MWQPPATRGYEAPEALMACLRDLSEISIKSNLNGHMRLAAVGWDSTDLLEKLHMLFLSSGLSEWT